MFTRSLVAAGAFAGLLAFSPAANAALFEFSYSADGYSGDGEFTATLVSPSVYDITNITGTANGSAITGTSLYAGADNVLYYPATGSTYVDFNGISFSTAVNSYNIYTPDGSSYGVLDYVSNPVGYPTSVVASFTVTAVPEASTWALMLLGFAGLGLGAYRKNRRISADVAV